MVLPTSYSAALLLIIFTMICWGSWANTQKLTGKWRFELFYFDYSIGVLLCAVIATFTLGAMNPQEISAWDSFALTSYTKLAWCVAGGFVFNLANILLVAAISVAGLSVAFPVGIGLALVIGVIWNYALNPQGHPTLLFSGAALVIVAIVLDAVAYKKHAATLVKTPEPAVKAAAPAASAMRRGSAPKKMPKAGPSKGIALSLISGVLMGSFYPLVEMGKTGDTSASPYGAALLFAVSVFLSTFLFNFFFAMVPITGAPLDLLGYLRGTRKQHMLGILGGIIWMAGTIANFTASSAPASVQVGPAVSYAMGQGATMISALWGILVWKEFAGAIPRVRLLLTAMLILFLCGLILVSIAPIYSRA
jgi:glucose uptake protein